MNSLERLYLDALETGPQRDGVPPRSGVLALALGRRRPAPAGPEWAAPFAGRVAAMDAVLASATAQDWSRHVVHGWTLHQLVAHLAAKDGLVAADVGAPVLGPPVGDRDPLGRTAQVQAAETGRPPEHTRQTWRSQAEALCRHLTVVSPTTPAAPDGLPIPVRDAMLARALETWEHADDAARACGLRMPPPIDDHLNAMAGFCARLLPWTMLASGVDGGGRTVRLTLTGPGGGTWLVPMDVERPVRAEEHDPFDASITADVVDFCFLLVGRGSPESFPAETAGDLELARDVLLAAPAFAGP